MGERPREAKKPFVLWFTGLSGSGKSTIADRVHRRLQEGGIKAERLDGDEIRAVFPDTGFDRPGRMAHIARVGFLASVLERNGICTIVSLISPYREAREEVRQRCGRFIEVHLSTPLAVCEARDVKGLYARSRRGEISGTGIESPMTVTMRFNLRRDLAVRELQLQRPSPMTKTDSAGWHITTAHGPDLMQNAKNAVRYMIEWLVQNRSLSESQAYCLCSVAGDLKISEIVDAPNWIVSFHMPLSIFA